jgi:glycosyltransferase involved in cell wall biosynthesis
LQQIAAKPQDHHTYFPLGTFEDGFVKGRISVVLPAYNEGECIGQSIAMVKKQFASAYNDLEIVVVDDGSTDNTRVAAEAVADDQIRVIGYKTNKGKGHAIRKGLNSVTGEFCFLVDSDMEISAKDLSQYIKALDRVDIAIGSKRHPLSTVDTPVMRRFLSLGFNLLERTLTGVRASDTQAGLKCARSKALYMILPLMSVKKYAFDAELLAVASLLRFKIGELPVQIQLRASFSPKKVFRMLIDLMGIAYRLRIKRWYQYNLCEMTETYKPIIRW